MNMNSHGLNLKLINKTSFVCCTQNSTLLLILYFRQTMYLPSLKTHAILCTYFVDSLHKSADIVQSDISVCQSLTGM